MSCGVRSSFLGGGITTLTTVLPRIVHRLDKETSGVLLVAKNDSAHTALACQFKERLIHKTYIAISSRVRGWRKEMLAA